MAEVDPYTYPESDVLINRLGIQDEAHLRHIEANVTAIALAELRLHRLPGTYNLGHLQAFHQAIFGSIYPWAGEIRSVSIAKTAPFALPEHIESYAIKVFGELAKESHLHDLERDEFIDRLTHYVAETNALHPFREGNGRTQRAFFAQLADDAGYRIEWKRLGADENIEASIASLNGDNSLLKAMLNRLVRSS